MAGAKSVAYETKGSPDMLAVSVPEKIQIPFTGTIGMLTVPADTHITDHYILQVGLTAVVRVENDKYVVVDYQVDEYGIGDSQQEAQQDLFDSLVDYLTSLEKRENRLGDRERRNLQILRSMLTKK